MRNPPQVRAVLLLQSNRSVMDHEAYLFMAAGEVAEAVATEDDEEEAEEVGDSALDGDGELRGSLCRITRSL